jgi:NADH-quinone oxidoreductase subunit F
VKAANSPIVTSAFEEIKSRAVSHWQELFDSDQPVIFVGTATCGRAAGALDVLQTIRTELERQGVNYPVFEVGCLGHCYAEPLVVISKPGYSPICYGYVNTVIAERLVREFVIGDNPCLEFVLGALEENELIPSFADFPRAVYEKKVVLRNCGHIDPTDIEHYIASDGYAGLTKALLMSPDKIITEIKDSGLRGRGCRKTGTGICYR